MAQAQFARDVRELANLLGLTPEAQHAPLASTSAHQRPVIGKPLSNNPCIYDLS
ncbi:hypothetical protein PGT21_006601 [Puccinia graminis f. sp. tritici]|uniref:Uncharacterized protein n=1 Tax=Puccinia graminis f. sp. tritici TaxID=56615 RepID=A0A5B0MVP3_PUCGR|nr:hypothetical protein PGT21_006601 [Puccinia graminis f. sp. tritici]KAA1120465.1 hypothetical protein PGTUg99_021437 [Puccinia graminis f. sp. tritici]